MEIPGNLCHACTQVCLGPLPSMFQLLTPLSLRRKLWSKLEQAQGIPPIQSLSSSIFSPWSSQEPYLKLHTCCYPSPCCRPHPRLATIGRTCNPDTTQAGLNAYRSQLGWIPRDDGVQMFSSCSVSLRGIAWLLDPLELGGTAYLAVSGPTE